MVYVEIKMINGRKYKYLRRAVRDGEKVSHINLKYVGPVEPIYRTGKERKTNASIYVRPLTNDEREDLGRATKTSNAFKRDRAKILLLSSQRYFARQIAEKISCEVRKVRIAIKAFNKRGLNALERRKAKGAEPKFTKEQRAEILKIVSTDPKELGLPFSTWSIRKLRKYLIDDKVVDSISRERLRQILHSEGMKIKKSKRFQYSNDPEFDKKNF